MQDDQTSQGQRAMQDHGFDGAMWQLQPCLLFIRFGGLAKQWPIRPDYSGIWGLLTAFAVPRGLLLRLTVETGEGFVTQGGGASVPDGGLGGGDATVFSGLRGRG